MIKRTFIAMLLCLSVLLSGCISMNTAMFKPKPDGAGDIVFAIWGGYWNIQIITGSSIGIAWAADEVLKLRYDVAVLIGCMSFVSLFAGIFSADISIRNSMQYRFDFQDTEPDEEPSGQAHTN